MTDEATARALYVTTTGGSASEYDALPLTGRFAWRAFAALSVGDAMYASARQAALDARRDAIAAGLLTPQAIAAAARNASTDPTVRNQRPVGAYNELGPPVAGVGGDEFQRGVWWYRPR